MLREKSFRDYERDLFKLVKDKKSTEKETLACFNKLKTNCLNELNDPNNRELLTIDLDRDKTLLHHAIDNKQYKLLNELMTFKKCFDPNYYYIYRGFSPLLYAVTQCNDFQAVRIMAIKKAIDFYNEDNQKLFLRPDKINNKNFAIFYEILIDYVEKHFPEIRLQRHIIINATCSSLSYNNFIKLLYKISLNEHEINDLYYIATGYQVLRGMLVDLTVKNKQNKYKILEALLDVGADPNGKYVTAETEANAETVIEWAIANNNFTVLELILLKSKYPIDYNLQDKYKQNVISQLLNTFKQMDNNKQFKAKRIDILKLFILNLKAKNHTALIQMFTMIKTDRRNMLFNLWNAGDQDLKEYLFDNIIAAEAFNELKKIKCDMSIEPMLNEIKDIYASFYYSVLDAINFNLESIGNKSNVKINGVIMEFIYPNLKELNTPKELNIPKKLKLFNFINNFNSHGENTKMVTLKANEETENTSFIPKDKSAIEDKSVKKSIWAKLFGC